MSHLPVVMCAPVLLVEDNADVREALRRMLELRGHAVAEARDGEEAWTYLDTGGRAAVIVLDVNLPRMDGRLFRDKLLAHEAHARIPVIIFTADDCGDDEWAGVTGFVRKTNPDALLDMVDQTARPALVDVVHSGLAAGGVTRSGGSDAQ